MACSTKIYQSIVNSCVPKKGIEQTAYWAYRSDLAMEFTDNTITSLIAPPLGVISGSKFFMNAGHDLVVIEDQPDRFIQKFTATLNDNSSVVDKMDDIVVFAKETGSTTWSVYGAKLGLWKTSQAQMINDNRATIAVEFASREGMEEEYEKYTTSVDIAALPNMTTFDLIYGGTIATGGAVKLTIDTDKTGYIKLPNGSILTTVAGVIDTTYTGLGGAITYYVPKIASIVDIGNSDLSGAITYNGVNIFECWSFNVGRLKSVIASSAIVIYCHGDTTLTNLVANNAVHIDATGSALTAKSIGDILYAAYVDNRLNVTFEFIGGTNAIETAVNAYLLSTYGVSFDTVGNLLITNGGTILIDLL